jgi:hypothetical protein
MVIRRLRPDCERYSAFAARVKCNSSARTANVTVESRDVVGEAATR